jgi:hypothetical protein
MELWLKRRPYCFMMKECPYPLKTTNNHSEISKSCLKGVLLPESAIIAFQRDSRLVYLPTFLIQTEDRATARIVGATDQKSLMNINSPSNQPPRSKLSRYEMNANISQQAAEN